MPGEIRNALEPEDSHAPWVAYGGRQHGSGSDTCGRFAWRGLSRCPRWLWGGPPACVQGQRRQEEEEEKAAAGEGPWGPGTATVRASTRRWCRVRLGPACQTHRVLSLRGFSCIPWSSFCSLFESTGKLDQLG